MMLGAVFGMIAVYFSWRQFVDFAGDIRLFSALAFSTSCELYLMLQEMPQQQRQSTI
jgi:hypothetical protein